jgi:hypothetical protein
MSSFEVANAERLAARAALAVNEAEGNEAEDNEAEGDDRDGALSRLIDIAAAADWKLLQTPARSIQEIRDRARVVSEMFMDVWDVGEPTDNRHRLMLAALVSEIVDYMPSPNGSI